MDLDHLLFDIGDRVSGWGELRRSGGEVWFDPPHGVSRAWPSSRRRVSSFAVRLYDVDVSVAVFGSRGHGPVTRWATVTGVWLGDAIRVEELSADPRPPRRPEPARTRPPCPPPVGGWPPRWERELGDSMRFDLGDLEETGAAVSVVMFRPGPAQAVLVVAAADEAAVERQLRPQLGSRLCVIPSRWTKAQVDQVSSALLRHASVWTLIRSGELADEQGQRLVRANLVRVLTEMAHWAVDVPDGLLEVDTVLAPAAR